MKTDDQKELERFLFDFGRIVLGKDKGGVIVKLKNARGVTGAWNALKDAAKTSDPNEYIGAILRHQAAVKPPISDEEFERLKARYQAKMAAHS